MEANYQHYADFWMHHQKLWGWYGCWDYGDVQHYYKGGYGWIIPPDRLASCSPTRPTISRTINVRQWRVGDYAPGAEWAYDNGRWGWTNTEGLPGLLMQMQYLRTGDRDTFFFAEAMARHVRDVDMRHAGHVARPRHPPRRAALERRESRGAPDHALGVPLPLTS
jgi:hypothetical protein